MLTLLITAAIAAPFDHDYGALQAFYAGAVSLEGVDYDTLASRRATLDAGLGAIATADASGFSDEQKLALYINAYNAYTVKLILDERPLKSIRDLDGGNPWKARSWPVAGEMLTLDQMEHQRVRKLGDGRVHAVVNCASKGCPPLPPTPLHAEGIDAQLDAGARRWVASNAYVRSDGQLALSRIFEWYAGDFTRWSAEVQGASGAQAHAIGFLRAFGATDLDPVGTIVWHPYDWSLNVAH